MANNLLQLAHWRRSIAELYAAIRHEADPALAWQLFCRRRDGLFARHGQTPLNGQQRDGFTGLAYFAYDPDFCVLGRIDTAVTNEDFVIDLPGDGRFQYKRIANIHFTIKKQPITLNLYWVDGYGGGLFLPFRDRSNQKTTYGGGRYLYDAIKGADLGMKEETLLLDFNFAYNPSCAYNDQWVCPLAPTENWLEIAIEAGEKRYV